MDFIFFKHSLCLAILSMMTVIATGGLLSQVRIRAILGNDVLRISRTVQQEYQEERGIGCLLRACSPSGPPGKATTWGRRDNLLF
jgi:hypothetical protein